MVQTDSYVAALQAGLVKCVKGMWMNVLVNHAGAGLHVPTLSMSKLQV